MKAIPTSDFQNQFQKLGDLLWFEGPILSHFIDGKKEDYFIFWTDQLTDCNRWLLFKVSEYGLRMFFFKKKSVRELFLDTPAGAAWMVEIDTDANWRQHNSVDVRALPADLLPGEKSFFDHIQYEEYALDLKEQILSKHRFEVPEFIGAAAAFQPSFQI